MNKLYRKTIITVLLLTIFALPHYAHAEVKRYIEHDGRLVERKELSRTWDRQDKILLATYGVLSLADGLQTHKLEQEYNPLLRDRHGRPDMDKVWLMKGAALIAVTGIAHYTPRYRKGILWFGVASQTVVVGWNMEF